MTICAHAARLVRDWFQQHSCDVILAGVAITLSSCAQPHPSPDRPATPEEIAKWRQDQRLTQASDDEIKTAQNIKRTFANGKATSPDGTLKVVFLLGKRVGELGHLSTTSTYTLQDADGKSLAEAPSCVARFQGDDGNNLADQAVWFAPDGKRVVVYEYAHYGLGPPPTTIVFQIDGETPGAWKTRFLELPFFTGGIYGEGAHSTCLGIINDELLFDASTGDGKVSKKSIREFKETYPFPFTIG
jgi:hypothetical protein